MARKTLEDFDNDYQKYADYLESADCMQDDGIDVYGEGRNVYSPTDGDWRKGHGHLVDNSEFGRKNWERKPEHSDSKGRPWYNKWLKYCDKLELTQEEVELLNTLFDCDINNQDNDKTITKRR